MLQESYLYIEQDDNAERMTPPSFVERYCVLFPFCGLKWYDYHVLQSLNPVLIDPAAGDQSKEGECGWVFGGRVRIDAVLKGSPTLELDGWEKETFATTINSDTEDIDENDSGIEEGKDSGPRTVLYPFSIKLKCHDDYTTIYMAASSEELRASWITSLTECISMQQYLGACSNSMSVPSRKEFKKISNVVERFAIELADEPMSVASLAALYDYVTTSAPHGSMLHTLRMQRCCLSDSHAAELSAFLGHLPHLHSLSLADNYLTDAGVTAISSSIKILVSLQRLDISGNAMGDEGCAALTEALGACEGLKYLDISRNVVTSLSIRNLTLRLARHSSIFTHLSLAHNPIGDGAAALGSLLMYNKPSSLQVCDLSHCGVTDLGIKELASAIPKCGSLMSLMVRGTSMSPTVMIEFIEAVASHHAAYARSQKEAKRKGYPESGLTFHIGGLRSSNVHVDGDDSDIAAVAFTSLRRAVPYISDQTLFRHVLLRRRWEDAERRSMESLEKASPIICLRVKIPRHFQSTEEVLEGLSRNTGADMGQFRVLSTSDYDEASRTCFLTFILTEPSSEMDFVREECPFSSTLVSRLAVKDATKYVQVKQMPPLRSAADILLTLQNLASVSHPCLVRLGVQSCMVEKQGTIAFQCNIDLRPMQGLQAEYMPLLTPTDHDYPEPHSVFDSIVGDEAEILSAAADRGVAIRVVQVNATEAKASAVLGSFPSDHKPQQSMEKIRARRQKVMNHAVERRERRRQNEMLIITIRKLVRSYELPGYFARFWEGALGNASYRHLITDSLQLALDEDGLIHAVSAALTLLDAMHARDMAALAGTLLKIGDEKLDMFHGVHAKYGRRLLSSMLSLQREAQNISGLTENTANLAIVERFLLQCGIVGYSGPEMFSAVEIRQKMVVALSKSHPLELKVELKYIKLRAMLSNLMISRDFGSLRLAVDKIVSEHDEKSAELPEVFAARKLLNDVQANTTDLRRAVKSKDQEAILQMLSKYAYLGMPREGVLGSSPSLLQRAHTKVRDAASNPRILLVPVLQALRNGDLVKLDVALRRANAHGWHAPELDAESLSKVVDVRSRLVAVEGVKAHLVRLALSVRNGFQINSSELFQVLRKARQFSLAKDTFLQPYFKTLQGHMRKFSGMMRQEEAIQAMIEKQDVEALEEVLSGRGTMKLIVNAPSLELADSWIEMLQKVCDGEVPRADGQEEQGAVMVGTMEKAAKTETGTLRGWRQRYFVLDPDSLQYFTSKGGDRKGVVRVRGGRVRRLSPEESAGRPYGFEVQEGRDMTLLNAGLIADAQKVVTTSRLGDLHKRLTEARKQDTLEAVEEFITIAEEETNIESTVPLMREAKAAKVYLERRKLLTDLNQEAVSVRPFYIAAVLDRAFQMDVDPNNFLLSHLLKITEQSDVTQHILRARGAALQFDDSAFRKAMVSLSRFDIGQFTMRDSRMISALMLQHAAYQCMRSFYNGESLSDSARLLRNALKCCRLFLVETEPMQLAKLLILISETGRTEGASHGGAGIDLASYIDQAKFHIYNSSQYSLDRYPDLNTDVNEEGGFFSRNFGSGGKTAPPVVGALSDAVTYITSGIKTSLLSTLSTKKTRADGTMQLARDMFGAVQAVMGDKPLKKIRKNEHMKPREDTAWVTADLCALGRKLPEMRDELYMQVCKQISSHPNVLGRLKGWLLFSAFAHSFPCSDILLPYLKNFIVHSAATETATMLSDVGNLDNAAWSKEERRAARRDEHDYKNEVIRLTSYCLRLLNLMNMASAQAEAAKTNEDRDDLEDYGGEGESSRDILTSHAGLFATKINRDLGSCVLGRAYVSFEVTVMTGSTYRLTVQYGELDSPLSILPLLYGRMVGGSDRLREISESEAFPSKSKKQHAWNDWLLRIFRGFAFYELPAKHSVRKLGLHMDDLPVQPDHDALVPWEHDLMWELQVKRAKAMKMASESAKVEKLKQLELEAAAKALDDLCGKTLVLRKRIGSPSEKLAQQLELFGDQVADRDIVNIRQFWTNFLSASLGDSVPRPLPNDALRVDLLFAEESRWVNSGMYTRGDKAPLEYLLSLQIAIAWSDTSAFEWGDGDDGVVGGVDLSVRSSQKSTLRQSNSESARGRRATGRVSAFFKRNSTTADEDMQRLGKMMHKQLLQMDDGEGGDGEASKGQGMSQDSEGAREIENMEDKPKNRVVEWESGSDSEDFDWDLDSEDVSTVYSSEQSSLESDKDYSVTYSDEDDSEDDDDDGGAPDEQIAVKEDPTKTILSQKRAKSYLTSYDDLTALEVAEVEFILMKLGVEPETVDVANIINLAAQHHSVAKEAEADVISGHFRYFVKRAYLHYAASLPLYGCSFTESVLETELGGREVIVAVNTTCIRLLDPYEWSMIMHAPLCDIEKCDTSVETTQDDDDEDDSDDSGGGGAELTKLLLNINGMDISLISPSADEQQSVLLTATLEALGRGINPHGTEGGNDILNVGEALVAQSDPKAILQSFVNLYPNMPVPPAPAALAEAADFFELPKSRMTLMMEERADEELAELEQARLAGEARAEKLQQQREQGKLQMKRLEDDDDGEDDSDADSDAGERPTSKRMPTRKTMGGRQEDSANDADEVLQAKIDAAVVGIPASRGKVAVPGTPAKKGGKLKLDRQEKFKVVEKPILRRTVVPDPLQPPPVSVQYPTDSQYKDVLRAFNDMGFDQKKKRQVPQTQWAVGHAAFMDADDSSVAFENLGKSYSSRKAEQAVLAESTKIAQKNLEKELDDAGDYLPISPLKRKQGHAHA